MKLHHWLMYPNEAYKVGRYVTDRYVGIDQETSAVLHTTRITGEDGVYEVRASKPAARISEANNTKLSKILTDSMSEKHEWCEIAWSSWQTAEGKKGLRIGSLRGQPVCVNSEWLTRVLEYPGARYVLEGWDPAKALRIVEISGVSYTGKAKGPNETRRPVGIVMPARMDECDVQWAISASLAAVKKE